MKEDLIQHRDQEPFDNIKNGTKTMEIRLSDEKRQKIKVGHIIKVVNRNNENDTFFVKVTELSKFPTFEKLYEKFGDKIKPYEKEILAKVYSKEDESKYGVLAIHIELI